MLKSMCRNCSIALVVALSSSIIPTSIAYATSDDAWEKFRLDVEKACRGAADGVLIDPTVLVDPFGSKRYGLALMLGAEKGVSKSAHTVLCVFDKASRTVEIGTPF